MAAVRTTLVTRKHAYTGEDVPWMMDVAGTASGTRDRLFHLLSGGGMQTFGTPRSVYRVQYRQARFLGIASVLAVLWLVFLFV